MIKKIMIKLANAQDPRNRSYMTFIIARHLAVAQRISKSIAI